MKDDMIREWDRRQWERIEEEYGEPVQEVVRVMHHEMRVPLRHVARALYVSENTLRKWCKQWGVKTMRTSYTRIVPPGKVQKRAKELGYESPSVAITALRTSGKQWNEVREILQCGDATMCRYLDDAARGYQYVSPAGLEVKRRVMAKINETSRARNMPPLHTVVPNYKDAM